ncbi:MAG: SGNH/GDSL hydrolase family protein [Syntrophomonadaceae bacterium]|nr:SGNH/GDSL hydrolase family protein [Syntrophomonadaceae bacterium]MDD3022884.1 SGNH/GDSL hydrolase family protein [Syntrophomonadaceae bacterium]
MPEKIKIVCLGDSITYGFPFGHQASWVRMLDDVIDAELINKGINGNTTSDMLGRFERAVLKYNPSYVIIMGGINDVICGESYDRIIWNLRSMAEKALAADIKVIMGIPTAVDDPSWEKLISRIRLWIKVYAEEKGLEIIDFSKAFFDSNGKLKNELLLADGGHPTMAGYEAMFEQIDLKIFK